MVKVRLAGLVLVGALAPASCALIAGLDGEHHVGGGTTGGGGSCELTTVPPRPTGKSGGDIDFVVAASDLDLDEGDQPGTSGLDLDGVCSCPAPTSCKEPSWAKGEHCDGPNGRDNATGRFFHKLSVIFSSSQLAAQLKAGDWTMLTRIRAWNGEPDDDEVEVDVYTTTGLTASGKKPMWDGKDAWPVAETCLDGGKDVNAPLYVNKKAYVAGGVLVSQLPTSTIHIISADLNLRVDLVKIIFTARIESADGGGSYRLTQGVIAGTWRLKDVFQSLADIRVGGSSICLGDSNYYLARDAICSYADLAADKADPEVECDALSLGIGFETSPAVLGPVTPLPAPSGEPCDPSMSPATDSCGT